MLSSWWAKSQIRIIMLESNREALGQRNRLRLLMSGAPLFVAIFCGNFACADLDQFAPPEGSGGHLGTGASANTTSGGGTTVGAGGGSQAGTGGSDDPSNARDCEGGDGVSAKRIVRLSFNQVANSLATLIHPTLGTQITEQFELVDAEHRAFPPLQSPREGNSFTDQSWSSVDQIAQAAGAYVLDNLAAVTGCGTEPTDDCALNYLTALAEKSYRRPLSADELSRLTTLYTADFIGTGAPTSEAIEYGVYAIFQSPHFLYRTEFGSDVLADSAVTQVELASMLSYFLTDDTPDEQLTQAAAQGALATPEQVGTHVDRILLSEAARENLHGAMMSYFSYPNLENQIIQDDSFTGEMRASMYREAEIFLEHALWSESLNELLLSKKSYINEVLAPIYGLESFPPAGAVPDAESFYEVELPTGRTGLLTQAGFLANRSRPDHTSVVGRGLLIKNAFLCTETPLPNEGIVEVINSLIEANPDATEREMADIRASSAACSGCHHSIDPYGLALDTFDVLGRYRTTDDAGRPIDPSVVLPEEVGGAEAKDIVEVAQQLAASGAFGKCMSQNLMNYAFADVSAGAATIDSCAVMDVAATFEATDGTFSSLVKAVVTSPAFAHRTKGEPQ
jgi:hypothetical protein